MTRVPEADALVHALAAELRGAREYLTQLGDRLVDAHSDLDQHIANPDVPLEAWTIGTPVAGRARDHVRTIARDLDHAIDIASTPHHSTVRPLAKALAKLRKQLCDTCRDLGLDVLDNVADLARAEAAKGKRR